MRAALRCGFAAVAGLLWGGIALAQQGPSYDCAKAATADEKVICADPKLAELDRLGAEAYRQARAKPRNARKSLDAAKAFLASRRACDAATECIMREQAAVLETYRGLGADVATPDWAKLAPGWAAGAAPAATVKSLDSAGPTPAQVAAAAAQSAKAGAKPAAPPQPAKWSGPCRVEQTIGGVWLVRVEESFSTIRVQMVYATPDTLRLKTRDDREARAKVFPYTYSASVTPSGKPEQVGTDWQYEQVFVSVDPGTADLDPAVSVDVRIGNSSRTMAPGAPTILEPKIADEIGRSVTGIVLAAGEQALTYPLDRVLFDQARQRMRELVDEVAAKALAGKCFG